MQLESRLDERVNRLETRPREDMKQLTERVARMEHSQAKLEGLLEGLRAAITRTGRRQLMQITFGDSVSEFRCSILSHNWEHIFQKPDSTEDTVGENPMCQKAITGW